MTPTSVTGSEMTPRNREAGFTLVEIMVALTVLALMTGVVVLSLPTAEHALRTEMRQLAARLQMAAEESIVSGRIMGFEISDDGYAFHRFGNGGWARIEGERVFASHEWSEATHVALDYGSFFPQEPEANDAAPKSRPSLRFDPTGLPAEFTIDIERGDYRLLIRGHGGAVEVTNADP